MGLLFSNECLLKVWILMVYKLKVFIAVYKINITLKTICAHSDTESLLQRECILIFEILIYDMCCIQLSLSIRSKTKHILAKYAT